MASLLDDSDSDVRILATELARNMPAADATHVLCTLLEHEQHPNVCAAAIDVLAEVGTRDALPAASGVRRTICRSPVSAVRRVHSHRSDFRRGSVSEWRGPDAHGPRAVPFTQEDVGRLCEFLYRRTGMSFDDSKRYYIDRRLAERIAATGSASFQSYFAVLRSDADQEIEHLVNAFTVNETYFNREDHQLRCMTSDLLGRAIRGRKSGEPIRIWSIPCSTGEEPYSIAIWLMENWNEVDSLQYRDRRLGHRHPRARGRGRRVSMASAPSCGSPRA